MNIAYIGTPDFSATFLKRLVAESAELGITVPLVITQPDHPVGRKQTLTPSPVRVVAEELGIPVSFDQNSLKDSNVDLVLLFAYGNIIPQRILDIPKYGFWNIHPSLLPAYRGASPITYPILLGDRATGVSIMQMDADLDHGPVIAQMERSLNGAELRTNLEAELTDMAFQLFASTIQKFIADTSLTCHPQDHSAATFTRQLTKADGYIPFSFLKKALSGELNDGSDTPAIVTDFRKINTTVLLTDNRTPAEIVYALYRAFISWPGIWTTVTIAGATRRLKLLNVHMEQDRLALVTVQLEGKTAVDFSTFTSAYGQLL